MHVCAVLAWCTHTNLRVGVVAARCQHVDGSVHVHDGFVRSVQPVRTRQSSGVELSRVDSTDLLSTWRSTIRRHLLLCFSFYLVLPNLTHSSLCRSDKDSPGEQQPLWWLSHPLSALRRHAPGLQLVRSFSLSNDSYHYSDFKVPSVLRTASVRRSIVWQLGSDICGAAVVLRLMSHTGALITVNLTTATTPSKQLDTLYIRPYEPLDALHVRPPPADKTSAENYITYSPHSHTFMLLASHLTFHASTRHFRWQLPVLVPITLYLPIILSFEGLPIYSWAMHYQHNVTGPAVVAPSVALLHQHGPNSACSAGGDTSLGSVQPAMQWNIWHLLGLHAGHERLELSGCAGIEWLDLPPDLGRWVMYCQETEWRDIILEIEFVDRDAIVPQLLPAPV